MTSSADAQVWLSRAERTRRLAEQMAHPATRRELLLIADLYQGQAERVEERRRERELGQLGDKSRPSEPGSRATARDQTPTHTSTT